MMKKPLLRDSDFLDTSRATGAVRRSAQIAEIANSVFDPLIEVRQEYEKKSFAHWLAERQFRRTSGSVSSTRSSTRKRVGHRYQCYKNVIADNPNAKALLWEYTNFHVAPFIGRSSGIKVIALPHNMESLVGTSNRLSYESGDTFDRLRNEAKYLQLADDVFTISKTDSWLLSQFGVNSHYLPYFPTQAIRQQLTHVREQRQVENTPTQTLFVPGSAFYKPIYNGMLELLKILKQLSPKINYQVDIAGFGSETLEKEVSASNFVFHGSVSDETFNQLQSQCAACIVFQPSGSGALTRIPEMLLAGIPVIANPIAARSAEHYDGVYVYEAPEELEDILLKDLPTPPEPLAPSRAEARFLQSITGAYDAK